MSAPDDQSQSGQESGPPDPPPGNGALTVQTGIA